MWEIQNILAYIIVIAALFFLVKKFFIKKKKTNAKGCDSACNCH
jgi:hypothetical protein